MKKRSSRRSSAPEQNQTQDVDHSPVLAREPLFATLGRLGRDSGVSPDSLRIAVVVVVAMMIVSVIEMVRHRRCADGISVVFNLRPGEELPQINCYDLEKRTIPDSELDPFPGGFSVNGHYLSDIALAVDASANGTLDLVFRTDSNSRQISLRPEDWSAISGNSDLQVVSLARFIRKDSSFNHFAPPALNSPNDFSFLRRCWDTWPFFLFFFVVAFAEEFRRRDETTNERKRTFIRLVLTVAGTVAGIVLICFIVSVAYHPDVEAIRKAAEAKLISVGFPKPLEQRQFLCSLVASPFLVLLGYGCSRLLPLRNPNTAFLLTGVSVVGLLSYLLLEAGFYPGFRFGFFIPDGIAFFAYTCFVFPGVVALYLIPGRWQGIACNILLGLSGLILVHFFVLRIYTLNYPPELNHFTGVQYSVSQILAGKTPLVDLTAQYGYYGLFMEPVLRLTGYGLLPFTMLLSALLVVSFVLVYFVLAHTVRNRFLRALGFVFLLFYAYYLIYFNVVSDFVYNPYYHVKPIRFFPGVLGIWCMVTYFRRRTSAWFYGTTITTALAPFWNIDTGLPVLVTWLCTLIYDDLLKIRCENKASFRLGAIVLGLMKRSVLAVLVVLAVWGSLFAYLFVRSCRIPKLEYLTAFHDVFVSGGLVASPMPLFGIGNVVILVYIVGLYVLIRALVLGQNDERSRYVMILTFLGCGLFPYYQVTPYPENLIHVWYPAILLAILFADKMGERILDTKKGRESVFGIDHFAVFSLLYCFALGPIIFLQATPLMLAASQTGVENWYSDGPSPLRSEITLVREHTTPGESVAILKGMQEGILYAESKTRSYLNIPSSCELFRISELQTIEEFLRTNESVKVFADTDDLPLSKKNPLNHYPGPDVSLPWIEILETEYDVAATSSSGTMKLYRRKSQQQ